VAKYNTIEYNIMICKENYDTCTLMRLTIKKHLILPLVLPCTRGLCEPDFHFGLFHVLDMDTSFDNRFSRSTWLDSTILTADCSVYLIWTHWFWLPIYSVFKVGLTAGVTGQQRMLTPPRHLILPLHLSEVRVALHSIL
jgi:hypothetical protein